MDEGPEFRHFASFVAVAETCNFGRAAERLRIAQPTLSLQIKQVESWVGERLFKRLPSGSELTEAGRLFLGFARKMLEMRDHAKHATSRRRNDLPLRFGYSLFARHDVIREALTGYGEVVPGGTVHSSSDCTAHLVEMLEDGRLEAAVITLPVPLTDLLEQRICQDNIVVCLRKDDPWALGESIPKFAVADRVKAMFQRDYHPLLYDRLLARFRKAGMNLHPTETFSAPSEMQYIVKTLGCFGLMRQGMPLDAELTVKPISGFTPKVITAVLSRRDQQRPAIPMLAYRMALRCLEQTQSSEPTSKPNQSAAEGRGGQTRLNLG